MNMLIQLGPRLVLAAMFLFMAVPKFLAPDITVHIFTELGVEPWGRVFTGLLEVLVASMLVFSMSYKAGVAGAIVVLVGAILSHLFVLGIVISDETGEINDAGATFLTAIFMLAVTLFCVKQIQNRSNKDVAGGV